MLLSVRMRREDRPRSERKRRTSYVGLLENEMCSDVQKTNANRGL